MPRREPLVFESMSAVYTAVSANTIGEGGAGRVYECTDEDGRSWAVKTLDPGRTTREKLKRFKNEQAFCERRPHERIIEIVDHGLAVIGGEKFPFVVMPRYDGSLRVLMQSGIDRDEILPLFVQVLDGVEAAHLLGVVHRDLKPENILYRRVDGKLVLAVADFGIAHFSAEELATLVETRQSTRLANFQYAAPEQRAVGARVDHRADIYALGMILNELFTGEMPHGTGYRTIASVEPSLAYLDGIVAKMLHQDPAQRPQSIAEIKAELIGRRNQFVTLQELDELRQQVVPTRDVVDSLIDNPVQLVGADWDGSRLILQLSQPVNDGWRNALLNMGGHESLMGVGPEAFAFRGSEAFVSVREQDVQRAIDYFKSWLPKANRRYAEDVRQAALRAEAEERRRLEREIAGREAVARVRANLRI